MGGVRNREQKKKNAHVYSSGGGGGSKGPAVVDKRNQELVCPHCDPPRVFKQSGRLQDHLKTKHADLLPPADDNQETTAEASSSTVTQKPALKPSSSQPKLQDVGSKGAYFDAKTPKMLLHEWILKTKQPKPRYKTMPANSSDKFKARIVLPHPKKQELDVVLFLQECHAADTEDEAAQRAAVYGLHSVAGDRSMDKLLPKQYIALWQELDERKKKNEERAVAMEARKLAQQEAAKKRANNRKTPSTVTMTEDKRRLVENLLSRPDSDTTMNSSSAEHIEQVIEELQVLGFDSEDATSGAAASNGSLSGALDWLCINLPENKLPKQFAPGAAGAPVTVLLNQHSANNSSNKEEKVVDPAVLDLMQYGYPAEWCREALDTSNGHMINAIAWLFGRATTGSSTSNDATLEEEEEEEEEEESKAIWEEECVALESIFDSEVEFKSPTWTVITVNPVQLEGEAVDILGQSEVELQLEAWYKPGYPGTVPILGIKCPAVPAETVLELTKGLYTSASESLLGAPMMFDLVNTACEMLSQCIVSASGSSNAESKAAVVVEEDMESISNQRSAHPSTNHKTTRTRRQPTAGDIKTESERLLKHHQIISTSTDTASMRATRQSLPAYTQRQDILQTVTRHICTVIAGATGCGKSTQVPQYILEQAIEEGQGGACNIIVTQPRRISAVGLATRVAAERGESVGQTIGYSVRLDTKQSNKTRMLFCTTGVLLRRLLSDPFLTGTTHVVLDEVHERSIESDLLLMLLKDVLMKNTNPGLKVVLMSATADAGLFANYFAVSLKQPSGILEIPGFTHPVEDLFLEDALETTGVVVGKSSKWASKKQSSSSTTTTLDNDADDSTTSSSLYSLQTMQSLRNVDETLVNIDLIEALVVHIASQRRESILQGQPNAILVFAPGADEISRIVRALETSSALSSTLGSNGQVKALPLHGGLPPSQQTRVFQRPGRGVLKVVVATNVAETSITIDDITAVIDTGRAKEMRYDPARGIARLQETWVSQAAAKQRRGRAGRVRPGICYRLFSRSTWNKMSHDTPPEVDRAPLQGLVMDVKGILSDADVEVVLKHMITPPDAAAVHRAVVFLKLIGALDSSTSSLTPLGRHLLKMPCDPRIGKMLIYGSMLRCLDPVLTIAAAHSFGRSVFWSTPDKREQAEAAKRELTASVAISKSDHLCIVAAYNGYIAAVNKGGRRAGNEYCNRYFVSDTAMESITAGRAQYSQILQDLGFITSNDTATDTTTVLDEMSGSARVVKAALSAGLYPQLLRVDHPKAKYQKVLGGAVESEADPSSVKFFDRAKGRVFLHPASINFSRGKFESGWLAYSEIVQTSKAFVRESSMIPVYAVLLFGSDLQVQHEEGLIKVDGWATFKAPARIAVLVRELRSEIAALLQRKIENPLLDISKSRVVEAMHHVLATDGF